MKMPNTCEMLPWLDLYARTSHDYLHVAGCSSVHATGRQTYCCLETVNMQNVARKQVSTVFNYSTSEYALIWRFWLYIFLKYLKS